MITVYINESSLSIEKSTTVAQLLKKTTTSTDGKAIAINDKIISKTDWETQQFNNNDNVLIIKATQGG